MSAVTLIRQAANTGVHLKIIDGKVKASGNPDAVALLIEQLRANKLELFQYLSTGCELSTEPGAWRALAVPYHQHHLKCPTCQAAGRGTQYGLRCGVGKTLWAAYQNTN